MGPEDQTNQDQNTDATTSQDSDVTAVLDADAIALQEAKEAVDAEDAAKGEGEGAEAEDAKAPDAKAPDADAKSAEDAKAGDQDGQSDKGEGDQPGPMVPKGRLDEEASKRRAAEDSAAYHQGQNELLKQQLAGGQSGAADAAKPPTLQEQRATLRDEKVELAKQYDAAELTAPEWQQKLNEVEDKLDALGLEIVNQQQARQLPAPVANTDLALEQQSAKLVGAHPVLTELSVDQLGELRPIAFRNLAAAGTPVTQDSAGTLRLRTAVAELATRLYGKDPSNPDPDSKEPPGPAGAEQQPTAIEKKVALADSLPPDTTNLGTTQQGGVEGLTEARINAMTSEEIEALPASTREQIRDGLLTLPPG